MLSRKKSEKEWGFLLFPAILLTCVFMGIKATAQKTVVVDSTSDPHYRIVIPGIEYKATAWYQWLWGTHYRKEWTTPVKVPVINFDTITVIGMDSVAAALTPTEQGGGRQTKTLRLKSAKGKQYVLRTINKSFSGALPEIARGTFVETIANDQVSIAHPFAPITVPIMAEAAGVYHTNPYIVFVPYSPKLGEYNEVFANTLCLFEERPDDNQEDAPNFGNSEKVISTAKMLEKVTEENDHIVDQKAFVRARLFDMFLGDWGRHEDQWRWARFDSGDYTVYKPIPRDRDQTYTQFDGFFPVMFTSPEELEHLQSFDYNIRNIKKYNFPARDLDRRFTNNVSRDIWISIAKDLQQRLTDTIITQAIHQLPSEEFAISGPTLIAKLKSRRNHLVDFAKKYYQFLSKEVEIVGSKQDELFNVKRLNNKETEVAVFRINKKGKVSEVPYYHRIFQRRPTHEIRLYGLAGNDIFHIEGNVKKGLRVRVIGGKDPDSLVDVSSVAGLSHKTLVYDNPENSFATSAETRMDLSNDSSINAYTYKSFKYNTGHVIKTPWYNTPIGFYVALGYVYRKYHWRKVPFDWQQKAYVYYSISQNSLGGAYEGVFNQVIGKWNLALNASFDAVRQGYFFGIGNETPYANKGPQYYQLHSRSLYGSVGLFRAIGAHNTIGITGFYQDMKILNREEHYASTALSAIDPSVFNWKYFAEGRIDHALRLTNDPVLPTKGIDWLSSITYSFNLKDSKRSITRYASTFAFYVPLTKKFSLAVRSGGAAVTGTPEFYQLNTIGGGSSLRGFRRDRFYGKTAFFNGNELRWITNARSYIFNGKIGLVAFVDDGRVWQPGETSNTWHIGYGGGVLLVPFNKVSVSAFYGLSKEDQIITLQLGKLL